MPHLQSPRPADLAAAALTAAQQQQLKAELAAERARLVRRLQREREAGGEGGAEQGTGVATDTALRHELVQAALDRLTAGRYGRCLGCDEALPFGRLLAMPEIEHCLACSAGGGRLDAVGGAPRAPSPRPPASGLA